MESFSDSIKKGSSYNACCPDFMLVGFSNDQKFDLLNLETEYGQATLNYQIRCLP